MEYKSWTECLHFSFLAFPSKKMWESLPKLFDDLSETKHLTSFFVSISFFFFCPGYVYKLYLMVRLYSWRFWNVKYSFFTITLGLTLIRNEITR